MAPLKVIKSRTFSGYFADRYGAKRLLIAAALNHILVSSVSPSLAQANFWAFFAARLLMGISEGFAVPCTNSLAARWFPPAEKSTAAALYTSGFQRLFVVGFRFSMYKRGRVAFDLLYIWSRRSALRAHLFRIYVEFSGGEQIH
ncbi:unnamed protein product, partial [Mesorhabditis spiculigera]